MPGFNPLSAKTKPPCSLQAGIILKPTFEPVSSSVLKRLDLLDGTQDDAFAQHAGTSSTRWIIPYADLLTLLFGLFIVFFAVADTQQKSQAAAIEKMKLEKTQEMATHESGKTLKQTSIATLSAVSTNAESQKVLVASLKAKLSGSKDISTSLSIHQEAQGVVISVTDNILFAPGQADLSAEAKRKLDFLSAALLDTGRPIRIEGHTDTTPIRTSRYPSNWELSTARATNIIQYLVQSRRFSASQLSAAGYGEFHPVSNNSSEEGKRKNRRVDIVVLNPPPVLSKSSP